MKKLVVLLVFCVFFSICCVTAFSAENNTNLGPWKYGETPSIPLMQGHTGNQVKWLQEALNIVMNAGLTVDGSFGPATYNAVINYQKHFSLEVDGMFGPASRSKMLSELTSRGYKERTYELLWPIANTYVTSGFGELRESGLRYHSGIDISANVGTDVYVAADGIVMDTYESKARGVYLIIYHSELGISTIYEHLDKILVHCNQTVKRGDIVARSGNSGSSTGPHLHFGVMYGKATNPDYDLWYTANPTAKNCFDPLGTNIKYSYCRHAKTKTVAEVAPTCAASGTKSAIYCADCNELLSGGETLAKLNTHTYTSVVTKAATCSATGIKTFSCSICKHSYTETIPKATHVAGTPAITAATCIADGSKVTKCKNCGTVMANEVIAKTAHVADTPIVTAATCVADGSKVTKCKTCGTVMANEVIAKTAHVAHTPAITAATCIAEGSKVTKCKNCGTVMANEVIAKTAHVADNPAITAATCVAEGSKVTKCKTCGTVMANEVIAKTAHTFSDWLVAAPAGVGITGIEMRNCQTCNLQETRDIAALAPKDNRIIMRIGSKNATVFGEAAFTDVPPIIEKNRTMLPARFVAEKLGASVAWDSASQRVTIQNDTTIIVLYIGNSTAYVNGVENTLDSPPFIRSDRTYTPVRFIAEKLGATVDWDGATSTVIITK